MALSWRYPVSNRAVRMPFAKRCALSKTSTSHLRNIKSQRVLQSTRRHKRKRRVTEILNNHGCDSVSFLKLSVSLLSPGLRVLLPFDCCLRPRKSLRNFERISWFSALNSRPGSKQADCGGMADRCPGNAQLNRCLPQSDS